jgi:recombination protein RecA
MSLIRRTSDLAAEVAASAETDVVAYVANKGNFEYMISTGSTLLDLAISGGIVRGGGIPGGIMLELSGPSGAGKTSLMAEMCTSAQSRGGKIKILDPEGRLNKDYCEKFGLRITPEDYGRPDTVKEVFDIIEENWGDEDKDKKDEKKTIDVIGVDSIAALSTEMEMDSEDKMGGKRAKDFSAGLRKTARLIAQNNRIVVFTNQERDSMASFGPRRTTPGGMAVKYYASLRIRVSLDKKIERKVKVVKEEKRIIGIESMCEVIKSSIDEPYRTAPVFIIFNYGIDDTRANLQWLKDHSGASKYGIDDVQQYNAMNDAINFYESSPERVKQLKDAVITLWEEVDQALKIERKPKIRT